MLRILFAFLCCFLVHGITSAKLKGTYRYHVPGAGSTKIVFTSGKYFEYFLNDKSGIGTYKKRGKKYHLEFEHFDSNPVARSYFEITSQNEAQEDSVDLNIRVFDNIRFDPLAASVIILKNSKDDTTTFSGTTDIDGTYKVRIPKSMNEIKLNISYGSCADLNQALSVNGNLDLKVYLSCLMFNMVDGGCLSFEEVDKLTLKVLQKDKDKNEVLISYPQAKSKYIRFLKKG